MIWFHLPQRVRGPFLRALLVLLSVSPHDLFPSATGDWLRWLCGSPVPDEWHECCLLTMEWSPADLGDGPRLFTLQTVLLILFFPHCLQAALVSFMNSWKLIFLKNRRGLEYNNFSLTAEHWLGQGKKSVIVMVAMVDSFETYNMPGTIVKNFTCVISLNPPGNSPYRWEYWDPEMVSTFSKVPQIV